MMVKCFGKITEHCYVIQWLKQTFATRLNLKGNNGTLDSGGYIELQKTMKKKA